MHLAQLRNAWRFRRVVRNPWRAARARSRYPAGRLEPLELKTGGLIQVRSGTSDIHVFADVYLKDVYQLSRFDPPGAAKQPYGCVIDIGGHIGIFATRVAPLSRRVISCEPMAENAALFARNIEGCGCANVKLLDWVIASNSGEIPFYTSMNKAGHSTLPGMDGATPDSTMVHARTLTDLFEEEEIERCDLLKLDCEGGEYDIMFHEGSTPLDRIDRIAMEYHDVTHLNAGYTGEEMERFLEAQGFAVERHPSVRHPNHGILHAMRPGRSRQAVR